MGDIAKLGIEVPTKSIVEAQKAIEAKNAKMMTDLVRNFGAVAMRHNRNYSTF